MRFGLSRGGLLGLVLGTLVLLPAAEAAAATGYLTQKPGTAGCISEDGSSGYPDYTPGTCTDGVALFGGPTSVTVSPDGKSAYVTSEYSGSGIAIFDRDTTTGELTQKPGTAGCISNDGTGGACAEGVGLIGSYAVTVSPDGKNAYVASIHFDGGIAVFDRDTTTGALTQKAGTAGCISDAGTDGACTDGVGLWGAYSVTVSPDGKSVYVAAAFSDAVAIFDRNTTTGELTQKPGTAGCISNDGTGGACTDGAALNGAHSVTVSPDGTSAYVVSGSSDAVAVFDRNTTTGVLTQKIGTAGCISEDGTTGLGDTPSACADGVALAGANDVTVSPDGKSVYVASRGSAVAVFDRDSATGALTQKPGTAGCISNDGTGGACTDGAALSGAYSVTVSPDGKSVYVAAGHSDAVAVFDRQTTSGELVQMAGTAGCISESGGACADGVALTGANDVTVSTDGRSAYVASYGSDAVAVFDRDDGTTPPRTTITSGPEGPTKDASPSFAFTVDEPGSTFECRLDSEPFAPCTSPKSYSRLADSRHTFRVRATDTEDNTEEPPIQRPFTVDTKLEGSASARSKQKQKGKKIVVKAKAKAEEDLEAKATGKVKVGKQSNKLKKQTKSVSSGSSKNLKLKPKKSKDARKIAKALKKGKEAKAKLTVKLTDEAGNKKSQKLSVKLKR